MRILLLFLLLLAASTLHATEASPVLQAYVKVGTDLATDNLEAAKKDAASLAAKAKEFDRDDLATEATAIAESDSISKARESFKSLSKSVIPLAKGATGFYVMTCMMTRDGDWVQFGPQVANPYFGKAMPNCGVIKKGE